ncbi:MAG: ATP-binding protein [Streptosporangiaceae bacterium]
MFPSPAGSGLGRGGPVSPGADTRLLAAPVGQAVDVIPQERSMLAEAPVRLGGCFARPLPLDRTCSAAARNFFREAVTGLDLPGDLVHDGVTMASELAANTLHAQGNVEYSGTRQRAVSGIPEFWLYLRGRGARSEVVCKIFDSDPGWSVDALEQPGKAPLEQVGGRGLQVVAALSAGQWGGHPSRGRLGAWRVPGKAVWFALRVPPAAQAARHGRRELSAEQAVDELEVMLSDRGLGGQTVRADEQGGCISVLSVSRHLTVWRYGTTMSWRAHEGAYRRMHVFDLVDVAEQIVCAHEEAVLADPAAV